MIALIPARAGSKRVLGKNTRLLGGKPLIQWTIDAARASGIFEDIAVCSDDLDSLRELVSLAGLSCVQRAPVPDDQPDIVWVKKALQGRRADAFAILRPTSPFRTAETIQRAWEIFRHSSADSLRAVHRWDGPHPGKMWLHEATTDRLHPIMNNWTVQAPYHSSPTQSLMPVYVQNASLEMAWTRVISKTGTIAGFDVLPLFTDGWSGFDINTPEDWEKAEQHVAEIASMARVSGLSSSQ